MDSFVLCTDNMSSFVSGESAGYILGVIVKYFILF